MKVIAILGAALLGGLSTLAHADGTPPTRDAPCPCHQAAPDAPAAAPTSAAYEVPDVKLVDQTGRPVELRKLLATTRPLVLNFIFTSCRTLCPVLSAALADVHREVGEQVDYVSISIDPEFDRPAVLDKYSKRFEVGPRWTLLTGTLEDSVAVQRAFGAYYGPKEVHRPLTFVRKAGGQDWTRFEGFPTTSEVVQGLGLAPRDAAAP